MMLVHRINKHLWASSFASTRKSNIHQLKKIFLLFKPQLLTIEMCACWALHSISNNEGQPGSPALRPRFTAIFNCACFQWQQH